MKLSFCLRGGILTQGLKIDVFSGSCNTFLFDSFGPGVKIRINRRDGGFPKKKNCTFQVRIWLILLDLDL